MKTNCDIVLPVTFNCWKHHSEFIKKQIGAARKKRISEEKLHKILLIIGTSQMDIYIGSLTPRKIASDIISKLKLLKALTYEDYREWLSEKGKEYKLIKISDNSVWALRLGNDSKKYVHIHPARYSPFSMSTFIRQDILHLS
jgi:hypothetical protein